MSGSLKWQKKRGSCRGEVTSVPWKFTDSFSQLLSMNFEARQRRIHVSLFFFLHQAPILCVLHRVYEEIEEHPVGGGLAHDNVRCKCSSFHARAFVMESYSKHPRLATSSDAIAKV